MSFSFHICSSCFVDDWSAGDSSDSLLTALCMKYLDWEIASSCVCFFFFFFEKAVISRVGCGWQGAGKGKG